MKHQDAPATANPSSTAPAWALFVLFLVYTFNFIDRQIIGILAGSIQKDLGLDDEQLGLMGGLAFALFYTGLGIPIAWLADRRNRVVIIAIAVAVWSAFTAVCGLAQNFWQLFAARMGVGVGEAGGVAPSYSLIADYFKPHLRARALAVFSFGIPLGSALGVLFGGLIAAQIDWRAAFIVVGLAGLVLTPLLLFTVKEPPRGRYDPPRANSAPVPLAVVFKSVTRKPSFWLLSFGASCSSIMGYGLIFWAPSFFERSYGLSLVERSWLMATIIFFGGVAGIWLGGFIADKLSSKGKGAYAGVPAVAFALAAPCYAAGVMVTDLRAAFVLFLIPQALSLAWLGPVNVAVQGLAAPAARATVSALFLFINNLIGIGLGTYLMGRISKLLGNIYGEESLRYAILYCTAFYVLAAVLMYFAARRLAKDWHDQPLA
jgi:MFS family permease